MVRFILRGELVLANDPANAATTTPLSFFFFTSRSTEKERKKEKNSPQPRSVPKFIRGEGGKKRYGPGTISTSPCKEKKKRDANCFNRDRFNDVIVETKENNGWFFPFFFFLLFWIRKSAFLIPERTSKRGRMENGGGGGEREKAKGERRGGCVCLPFAIQL